MNKTALVIETDLGGDPDDLFTLLWLYSLGLNIKAILISPGYRHQCALARFIISTLHKGTYIGSARYGENKGELSGFYKDLLNKYGGSFEDEADGPGDEVFLHALWRSNQVAFLGIGPLPNLRMAWNKNSEVMRERIACATMQGGFLPYNLYRPTVCLDKFEGKHSVPTFNLNGDVKGAQILIDGLTCPKRFVSKNVCHTMVYDADIHQRMMTVTPRNEAHLVMIEALNIYMQRHPDKKFHDPLAAACHLWPEIATWFQGVPRREKGGWTVDPSDSDQTLVIADVNRELFWNLIIEGEA